MRNISLKIKLLLLLLIVSITMLVVHTVIAARVFSKDKMAYVYESSLDGTTSIAEQIKSELTYTIFRTQDLLRGLNLQNKAFEPWVQQSIDNDNKISALLVYRPSEKIAEIHGDRVSESEKSEISAKLASVKQVIQYDANRPDSLILGLQVSDFLVLAKISQLQFVRGFVKKQSQNFFLLDNEGKIILQGVQANEQLTQDKVTGIFQQVKEQILSAFGTIELADGEEQKWLVSMANVGGFDFSILSFLDKKQALSVISDLRRKTVYFALLLIALLIFISVYSINNLTANLSKLLEATEKVSSGNLNFQVDIDSRDEVGKLFVGFNRMVGEIKRLLVEEAEKSRMEGELETARLVQSTLFPERNYGEEKFEIAGMFDAASECGGDWWQYEKIGEKVYLWIGDATGHGVPAALITSAAKSASVVISSFGEQSLSQMMELMNKAVFSTSRGKINMTFFLACYDTRTGELEYCNASHDAPFWYQNPARPIKRSEIQILLEANGRRLGEGLENKYESKKIQLQAGDWLIFYTDGVTELNNSQREMFGERRLSSVCMSHFNNGESPKEAIASLERELQLFRGDHPLQDDVTFFIFKRKD